ncbi:MULTISPECIES: hypothetical protein [unclassified Sphingomonas]|uniref:hypothetical protein n=1 Tax=unclassified Sphingomonas TaxID=196159 RepID=UPI00226AF05C|nr:MULTISPECIES: hypothetical protein [unclassified Sphingomonas]
MPQIQQTFANRKDGPIYISVEPWPECFELEPGDELTLIWNARAVGETAQVDFINERELIVHPEGAIDQMQFLINGKPAREKSWDFRHQ